MRPTISVRRLQEHEVSAADHIMRLAFGTFIGIPDPASFLGTANYVRPRWLSDPEAAFAAEVDGELAGSNFAANWGSVGYFGPLSIHPKFWDAGVGKRLIEPVMDRFESWGIKHAGLFTFPHSPKHVALYQKFGFAPRFLTAVMSKPLGAPREAGGASRLSELSASEQDAAIKACGDLTDAIFPGLSVESEIRAVAAHGLGDTILLWQGSKLAGLAVCHMGAGTEAGADVCYIKFAAVRPGDAAAEQFSQLLDACEATASTAKISRIVAGMNTARIEAYRYMFARGFRTDVHGVVMQRPDESGYNRPGAWVIDDWR